MGIKKIAGFKYYILIVVCFLMIPMQTVVASSQQNNDIQYTSQAKKAKTKNKFLSGKSNKVFPDAHNYMGTEFSFISEMVKSNYTFKERYGKNSYPTNPLMYSIFVGHKFDDRFGFELTYETQNRKKRTVNLQPGDFVPGLSDPIQAGQYCVLETKAKTEHFQAVLHITSYIFDTKENINIWTQIGVSRSQIRADQKVIDDRGEGFPTPAEIAASTRTFKKSKIIPVAKVGIHYNWTDKIGFRASAGWRHLSMLKVKARETNQESEIKLKDGFNFGVGVYFKL